MGRQRPGRAAQGACRLQSFRWPKRCWKSRWHQANRRPTSSRRWLTQPATASDDAGPPLVEQEQVQMGLSRTIQRVVFGRRLYFQPRGWLWLRPKAGNSLGRRNLRPKRRAASASRILRCPSNNAKPPVRRAGRAAMQPLWRSKKAVKSTTGSSLGPSVRTVLCARVV